MPSFFDELSAFTMYTGFLGDFRTQIDCHIKSKYSPTFVFADIFVGFITVLVFHTYVIWKIMFEFSDSQLLRPHQKRTQSVANLLFIPYACHYKTWLLYLLPHFWRPFLCFQGFFSENYVFMYVWLVFKIGLQSRACYDGTCIVTYFVNSRLFKAITLFPL